MGSPWRGMQPRGALDRVGVRWLVEQTAGVDLPRSVVLPRMQIPIPTLAAVPSTLGEVSVASLDARSPSSCEATAAALAAAGVRQGVRCGHTKR